nr:S8 family serine peptidase [Lachnospiraceae bacterium]
TEVFTEAETVTETETVAETEDPALPAEIADCPEELAIPAELLDEAAEAFEEAAPEEAPFLLRRLSVFLPEGALADSFGAASASYYPAAQEYILDYETEEAAAAAYNLLCAVYGEDCVMPDLLITAQWEPFDVTEACSNSWGVDMMQLDLARDLANADPGLTQQITVAVLDTGINTAHEIFAGRLSAAAASFIQDEEITDSRGHGTHVAGIIADGTPDRVELLPLKVLGSGGQGGFTEMVNALYYAIEQGADVVNMSFGVNMNRYGSSLEDESVQKWIKRAETAYAAAEAAGIVCIVAASNDGGNADSLITYPAVSEHVLAISSIDQSRTLASTSNYGSCIDFTAPGVSIRSAGITGTAALTNKSGTSMASPHIAAAAALLRLYNPMLSNSGIVSLLRSASEDLGVAGRDDYYGCGLPVFADGEVPVIPVAFRDVTDPETFWFEPVGWAVEKNITTGWEESDGTATFRPWNSCNRASAVTFLWRLAGRPDPDDPGAVPFTDMTGNDEFDTAIQWAVEQGITTGWEEPDGTATFRPWNTCNRAAIVTFLWRYAGRPEAIDGYQAEFRDMTGNEEFDAAIAWAAANGITTGWEEPDGTATFRPWNTCNRASIVTFLWRYAHLPES